MVILVQGEGSVKGREKRKKRNKDKKSKSLDNHPAWVANSEFMRRWITVLLVICGLLPGVALAEVYHWVDEQGTRHYATGLQSVPERYRANARPLHLPTVVESQPGSLPARAASLTFSPGSPILVNAKINGVGPVTLILDTGSDRTVVAPAALSKLGIPMTQASLAEIKGVTGVSPAHLLWVNSVEVGTATVGPLPIVVHDAGLGNAEGLRPLVEKPAR